MAFSFRPFPGSPRSSKSARHSYPRPEPLTAFSLLLYLPFHYFNRKHLRPKLFVGVINDKIKQKRAAREVS